MKHYIITAALKLEVPDHVSETQVMKHLTFNQNKELKFYDEDGNVYYARLVGVQFTRKISAQ
jgi:phage-related protein